MVASPILSPISYNHNAITVITTTNSCNHSAIIRFDGCHFHISAYYHRSFLIPYYRYQLSGSNVISNANQFSVQSSNANISNIETKSDIKSSNINGSDIKSSNADIKTKSDIGSSSINANGWHEARRHGSE